MHPAWNDCATERGNYLQRGEGFQTGVGVVCGYDHCARKDNQLTEEDRIAVAQRRIDWQGLKPTLNLLILLGRRMSLRKKVNFADESRDTLGRG
jgi:hypothetical protein